jgi:Prolipoprotein diacylglyceryltransferase
MSVEIFGWFALAAAICFFIGMLVFSKGEQLKNGVSQVFCVIALPVCLLASRLVFALASAGYFFSTIAQPIKMLNFFDGGYSMTGVLLGLIISTALTKKITKAPFGKLMDAAAFAFILPLALLRFAETYTTLGLGREVINLTLRGNAFFAFMDDMGTLRHAVFHYETAYALLLFVVVLMIRKFNWRGGDKALLLATLYGVAQIVFESMRDDFHMLWGFVRAQQVFAIFLPVAAIVIFSVRIARKKGSCKPLILYWVAAAAGIALGIIKEFDIDTSKNLFVDYGVMGLAVGILAVIAIALLIKSNKESA